MTTPTNAPSPAYGYSGGASIIDALADGKTLEFANPEGHTIKVCYIRHLWMNRDEIKVINDNGTLGGIYSEDPFEWLFGKLSALRYTLISNFN